MVVDVARKPPTGKIGSSLPQVMDELQNGAVVRTYSYGLERISEDQLIGGTWTARFYGYDGHGSTRPDAFTDTGRSALSESDRFLTNMAGSVTDTYQYDAFGNLIDSTGTTPNNYLFAGEQFDPALNFYYMRARYYRPATGRFWTMDPVWGKLCCGLSWNPYPYVRDNPVNRLDPTGRQDLFADVIRTEKAFSAVPYINTIGCLANIGLVSAQRELDVFGLLATTYGCVTITWSPTGLLLSFKSGIDLGACVYAAAEAIAVQNEYFATPTPSNERKAVLDYGSAVISCAVTGLAATLE